MGYKFLLVWVSVWSLLYAQATTPGQDVMSRPAALKTFKGTSAAAIADLLEGTKVPGGIVSVYSRCAIPSEYQFAFQGRTLKQELDYLGSIDASRKWIYRDGLVLVGSDILPRTILSTIISDIDIKSDDAVTLSTQLLLQSPEVRNGVSRAGFAEAMNPISLSGFSALSNSSVPTQAVAVPVAKHLHQITLGDALDLVATMKGNGVWHYEQFECGNKPTYRITWVVR